MMKKLLQFLVASEPQATVSAHVNVMLTGEGLMITHAWPDGRFAATPVAVPGAQGTPGVWAVGRPISLSVADEADGQAVLSMGGVGDEPLKVYSGRRDDVEQTAREVQRAWLAANSGAAGAQAPNVAPSPQWAGPSAAPSYAAHTVTHYHQATARFPRAWRKWAVVAVIAVGFVVGGWAAANYYLKPKGPGIDLSAMSIDDVASLDANPSAVRQVQESLMEAVGVGRAQAAEAQGKIEQDHIEALKAMGLQPGVSMKNAMACLAKK